MVDEESDDADELRSGKDTLHTRWTSSAGLWGLLTHPLPDSRRLGSHSSLGTSWSLLMVIVGVIAYMFEPSGSLWIYGPILVIAAGVISAITHVL